MNKNYRIVWSTARQAYVVADEKARSRGKSSTLRNVVAVAATALLIPTSVFADSLCGQPVNVITDAQGSSCDLGSNSSVEITSTGSINMGIAIPAIRPGAGTTDVGSITNAGALSSTGRVIALDSVNVSGKVWNKTTGTITGSTGINVKDSTVQGGVVNDGTIDTVTGIGIDVAGDEDTSQVDNGVVNNGTINSVIGVYIRNATVNDGISNTGTINADDKGIYIQNALINGGINNTGTAAEGSHGIYVENSTVNGGITNSGLLKGVYSGLYIDNESVVSHIENNGSIIGHYDSSSSYSIGLYISNDSEVLSIENNGTIRGDAAAILANGTLGSIIIGNNAKFIGDVRAFDADVVLRSGANFENTNAFDVKSVTVEQNSTFNIAEGIPTFNIYSRMSSPNNGITVSNGFINKGTLAVAPGVTGTIHGDYNQNSTGKLSIGVAGDNAYGKLVVNGTATLPSNANIFVDVKTPSGYSFSVDRLQDVLTAETLQSDGTFKVTDNSLLFDFSAVKRDNSIDLTLKKTGSVREIVVVNQGNNPAAGAAGAIDRIIDSGLYGEVTNFLASFTDPQELSDVVTQTLPLLTGASTTAASGALSSINRVVQARMDSNAGLSSGEGFLTDKHLWLKPFGSWADQDNRSGVAGYSADTMGFAIGSDATLNDKVRVGVAFAYAKADIDGASKLAPQSMEVDVYQLIGYGSYSLGSNTELNFQADVGQNDNSGKRHLGFMNATAKSDYTSLSTHLGAGIGHTLSLNDGITFTPSARLDYTTIRDESYREKGAGIVGLNVSSNRTEEMIASVDGKFNLKVTDNTSVALNVGAGYDITNDRASITAAYVGAPGFGFTTYGIEQSRWLLRSGIGLTHTSGNGTEVTARYDNEGRSGFSNQTASLKVRWAF